VQLFDTYVGVVGLFFVTGTECVGFMWFHRKGWLDYVACVKLHTGIILGPLLRVLWMLVCPFILCALFVIGLTNVDLMGAKASKPYPEGTGFMPEWSIYLGWSVALMPLASFVVAAVWNRNSSRPSLDT